MLSKPLRVFTLVLLWLTAGAVVLPAAPAPPTPSALTLTLLHSNDTHGHLLPFAYTEIGKSPNEQPSRGGAARRATLIRRLRAQITNPTMLIDSGDTFTRGPLANAYEGLADIEAMNATGYELAAVGNNEFKAKDGVDQNDAPGAQAALLRDIKRSRFPWICANAVDSRGAFLEGVQPYIVRDFQGVRVGFLGLTAPRSASYPQTKGWTISDPIQAAKEWIPKARANCDVLVALTHIGVDMDKALAAQTTGIDAIVGGDSHTFLYQAAEVANPDGVKVPIVQDGEFGTDLGRLDLKLARNPAGDWHLAGYKYALLPVGPNLPEAPDVTAALAPFVRPFQTTVGHLASIGAAPEARSRQTTQIVVDALRRQTGSDLALNPEGGGFFEVFRHPAVTRYDVYSVMPFRDNVVVASLTGTDIKALIEAHPDTIASGDIKTLDSAKTYKVAMVDYLARTTYKLADAKFQDTGRDMREVVIASLTDAKAQAAQTYRQKAQEQMAYIQAHFYDADAKRYHSRYPLDPKGLPFAFMWENGIQLRALVDATHADPAKYGPQLDTFGESLRQFYWDPQAPVPGFNAYCSGPGGDDKYYDDNAWVALGYLEAYAQTHDAKYLQWAKETQAFVLSGWDDKLGGGIYWKLKHESKNTCVNAPAAVTALLLYKDAAETDQLAWAKRIRAWTKAALQDKDGLYWDNQKLDGHIEKTKWTYNTALMIEADTLLYRVQHDKAMLAEAERVADSAIQTWQDPKTGAFANDAVFTHLLCESLVQLYEVDHNVRYLNAVRRHAAFGARYVHDPIGGGYWSQWAIKSHDAGETKTLIENASVARIYWLLSPYPTVDALLTQGDQAAKQGDATKAKALYQQAADSDVENAEALSRLSALQNKNAPAPKKPGRKSAK